MKRLISFLLAFVMVISALSMTAFAENTVIDKIDITVDFDKIVLNTAYTEGEVRKMIQDSLAVDPEMFTFDNVYLMFRSVSDIWIGTGTGENQVDTEKLYAIDIEVSLKKGFDWLEVMKQEIGERHIADCEGFTVTVNKEDYADIDCKYNEHWNMLDFYIPIGHASDEPIPEPTPEPVVFPDVKESNWFYAPVQYCAEKGYIKGYDDGTFGPADSLSRQDFVIILARIAGADLKTYKTCKLKDVDMNAYYGPAVAWATSEHIINGYADGRFGVGDPITREQVAVILYGYLGRPDKGSESAIAGFADKGKISSFAKDAMVWAVNNGVITGKDAKTLAPTATASRAEIATIITRMDQKGMFDA